MSDRMSAVGRRQMPDPHRQSERHANARRDAIINVRLPAPTRELIDSAAAVMGKSRTDFVVESARQHAIDVLLDQRLFALDEGAYEAFVGILDNPPTPPQKLRDLFEEKAPWER
jgi:uncharacterized protein (DUF1778 family)